MFVFLKILQHDAEYDPFQPLEGNVNGVELNEKIGKNYEIPNMLKCYSY